MNLCKLDFNTKTKTSKNHKKSSCVQCCTLYVQVRVNRAIAKPCKKSWTLKAFPQVWRAGAAVGCGSCSTGTAGTGGCSGQAGGCAGAGGGEDDAGQHTPVVFILYCIVYSLLYCSPSSPTKLFYYYHFM